MINLCLKTEYSFKKCYGKISNIHKFTEGQSHIGIADIGNTFGHVKLEKICKENGLRPVYGVRLEVVPDNLLRTRGANGPIYIFIAKNDQGLQELYKLVKKAWDNFYYKHQLPLSEMISCSNNLFVISDNPIVEDRLDFLAITTKTPKCAIGIAEPVFVNDNVYPMPWDKETYQLLAGARKHGDGFRYLFSEQTYPQHIMTETEFRVHFKFMDDKEIEAAVENTKYIAVQCDAKLQSAPMVKYNNPFNLRLECQKGAKKLGVELVGEYEARLDRELGLIEEKDFSDYFMIVAEMVRKAKKKMMVGPARGSAAGSLVCYLLDITTVDPLEHGLLFERFIDINRPDLPDIDIDFPDDSRQAVIKDLFKTYGEDNVYHISNINRLKPKSALDEFGMSLSIPKYKVEQVKDSIVDRSGGDARAAVALSDTLEQTDVGKTFVEEYPAINLVKPVEGHATHAGKHAAGIIVCNDELTKYCGVNTRENSIMYDKRDAEDKNLLKIDCLGLRTLTILQQAAEIIGEGKDFYYNLPIDDKKTFTIFQDMRLSGVFQFEGQAMQMLCKQMKMEHFNDIVAITALARPGPLHSGAANIYIKRRNGDEPIEYVCSHEDYVAETEDTMGVIVYQEQLMNLCRNVGLMDWTDVSAIRKAASKTMGKEFFDRYKDKFLLGTEKNGIDEAVAIEIWENMMTFGSWGMNKSHSVSYGYISYWCAYMKAHHPLAFAVATLNNAKSVQSAIKILRDALENDGLEYIPVDADESVVNWSISSDGKMLGGLTNIDGIGDKKALEIIHKRENGIKFTKSVVAKLIDPETPYDILYPTEHYWGELYKSPSKFGLSSPPTYINDVVADEDQTYVIIGKVISKDLRDLNEYNEVVKRGGKILPDNNLFLRIVIEDDTGQVLCKINRFDFDRLRGQYYSENLVVDESWLIIKGKISKGWRIMNIDSLFDLSELDMD